MRFDDNAEFRQQEIFAERDWSQEDAKEVEASRYNLNYIALDGQWSVVCSLTFCFFVVQFFQNTQPGNLYLMYNKM